MSIDPDDGLEMVEVNAKAMRFWRVLMMGLRFLVVVVAFAVFLTALAVIGAARLALS